MKNAFYFVLGVALIVWSFYTVLQKPAPTRLQRELPTSNSQFPMKIENSKLKIGEKVIFVEMADSTEERTRGLSGREALAEGTGMLFVFDEPGIYGFWMKDMNFAIDIIWLDENLNIIDIEKNIEPSSFPHVFYPPRPVKYVLETNPGEL